ncbi:Histidinol-phosphate aminotransferase [compost metagenome]
MQFEDAATVLRSLASRGIVVRDISAQFGLAGYLRISIGRPDENDALLDALRAARVAA